MPTIRDVARLANVSLSTVSLVLNNRDVVKMETRYKVLKAIETLGYVPNQAARSLVTKQKKVIGLIYTTESSDDLLYTFSSVPSTYMGDMLEAVVHETNRADYSIMLDRILSTEKAFSVLPDIMDSSKIDGALFMSGVIAEKQVELILNSGIPTVLVGSRSDKLDCVDTDPTMGFYLGTKHLLDNGHRDIAFINGPDASQSVPRKLVGYKKALDEAGMEFRPAYYRQGEYSAMTGYQQMKRMWEEGLRPTALIALDGTALGAARYLYEQRCYCPRDISIVGFEDGLLAEHSVPPLTSIRVRKNDLGKEACKVLLNRIQHPTAQRVKLILDPILIKRQSVRKIG